MLTTSDVNMRIQLAASAHMHMQMQSRTSSLERSEAQPRRFETPLQKVLQDTEKNSLLRRFI